MTKEPSPIGDGPVPNWPRGVSVGAGAYALAAGLITLAGWAANVPRLTDWKNDGISMFPNAAACAAMSGLAILLANVSPAGGQRAVRFLASAVVLVAGLTLCEHLTGANLGIDSLLFDRPWGQAAAAAPMRMGPPASLSFLVAGTGLLLLTGGPQARRATAALGVIIVAIGMVSFTGHLYGASQMYTLPRLTGIAMQTASVVIAVGLGLLASVPDREPVRTLVGRDAAGVLARRTLPILVGMALALGGVRIFIENEGLVDAAFGTALRTVVELGLLSGLLWWAAAIVRTHERALHRSEADVRHHAGQLATFLDTSAVALHRVGPDGSILWVNDAELEMLGYRREEYVGHHMAEFHVDKDVIADILARLHRGEKLREYPARMMCKNGSVKHVVIDSSVLWDEGRFVHTQCFTRDVTERMSAETTRALYAAIVESSDDAIISKDVHSIITSWNQGAQRLFGYTAAEAIGRSVTMLIPEERHDEEPAILGRILRGERIDHYETVRRHKDGTRLEIEITVSPIVDGQGTVIGASKIARNIAERRRMTEQREELLSITQRMREEAEGANRAKDEFLAMLGHELRNPLSAVRNAIAVATLDETSRDRAIEIARRQTDQLVRIVDDLLDIARITQGRVRLRKERLVLAEVMQRAVDGARGIMDERGHSLTLVVPAAPVCVEADAARLEQAVANLLANAAKYTDPGGTIAVTAEQSREEAVIRVRDNGIGIAPDVLPKVFDLFAQGERSLDRAEGGLGIGLTVVRRIVELHGGTVEASSAGLGSGSEFVIRLPALPRAVDGAPVPSQQEEAGHPQRQGRATRVLLAEDHPDAAESLMIVLEHYGHHVEVVPDGIAALEAARANPPDVMLIDIGLPGMSGYEVAQAVRRDPVLKHLVLVALTGYGRPEDKAHALTAGFDYHLAKPVDLEALRNLVGRLGGQSVASDSARQH